MAKSLMDVEANQSADPSNPLTPSQQVDLYNALPKGYGPETYYQAIQNAQKPQSNVQQIFDQFSKQANQYSVLDALNRRSNALPLSMLHDNPLLASDILTIPYDDYSVSKLGTYLQSVYPWLKSSTGIDGSLAQAYSRALQIPDPKMRDYGLRMVESLANSFRPGSGAALQLQQIQALQAQNPGLQLPGKMGETIAGFAGVGNELRLNYNLDGSVRSASILTSDVKDPKFLSAYALVNYLYPGLVVTDAKGESISKVHPDLVGATMASGFSLGLSSAVGDIGKVLGAPFKASEWVLKEAHLGVVAKGEAAILKGAQPVVTEVGNIATAGISLPIAAVGDINAGLQRLGIGKVTHGAWRNYQSKFTNPLDVFNPHRGFLGEAFNNTFGVTQDNPDYARNMAVGDFVSQWAGLDAIGEVARAFKKGPTVAVGSEAGAKAFAEGYVDPVTGKTVKGRFDNIVAQKTFEWRSKTPTEFIASGTGRSFVDSLLGVAETAAPGADIAGQISQKFKTIGMPPQMADILAEAAKSGEHLRVANAYVDYMHGNVDPVTAEAMLVRSGELGQQISAEGTNQIPNTAITAANGEPLRVYHGAPAENQGPLSASYRRPGMISPEDPNLLYGPGLYFTDNADIASTYATRPGTDMSWAWPHMSANVTAGYLDMQHPFNVTTAVAQQEGAALEEAFRAVEPNPYSAPRFVGSGEQVYRSMIQSLLDSGMGVDAVKGQVNQILRAAGFDGIEYPGGKARGGIGHRAFVVFDESQFHGGFKAPVIETMDAVQRYTLLAEKERLDQLMSNPGNLYPAIEYPKSTVWLRAKAHLGNNAFENFLGSLIDPQVHPHLPHFISWTDRLGGERIWNGFRSDAPADWRSENKITAEGYMRRAGVPEEAMSKVLGQLGRVTNDAEFKAATTLMMDTIRVEGRRIFPEFADVLGRVSDRTPEEMARVQVSNPSPVDGNPIQVGSDVLSVPDPVTGTPTGRPSNSAEMIDHFNLPSVNRLIEGTSSFQHLLELAKANDHPGFPAMVQLGRAISSFATALFKPIILSSRVPALIFRTQLEQYARAEAYGFNGFVLKKDFGINLPFGDEKLILKRSPYDRFTIDNPTDLGSIFNLTMEHPGTRNFMRIQVFKNGVPVKDAWQGITWTLNKWFKSPEVKQMLKGSADDFVAWMEGDSAQALLARQRFDPILNDPNLLIEGKSVEGLDLSARRRAWYDATMKAVDQHTGGMPGLRDSIVTGKLRYSVDPKAAAEFKMNDEQLAKWNRYRVDLNWANEHLSALKQTTTDQEAIRAAQDVVTGISKQMSQMERFAKLGKYQTVELANREAFQASLEKLYNQDRYTPPAYTGGFRYTTASNAESAQNISNLIAGRIYTGGIFPKFFDSVPVLKQLREAFQIGTASKADLLFTRGSTFVQAASDFENLLVDRGYTRAYAHTVGQAEGANVTREMFYDLNAKTSIQRQLRNVSYFLPAYQEILSTWLYKIPSQSYWPIGASVLFGKGAAFYHLMQDLHVIRKDSKGRDVVVIPGMSELFSKFGGLPGAGFLRTLDPKQLEDIVSFSPKSLNLVSTGLPSLSTQYTLPLNWLAKHDKTAAAIAKAIEPYGTETTFAPQAITMFYEMLIGHTPFWEIASPGYQQQIHDLGYDDALKQARVEIGPAPELKNYPDTPAGNAQYTKDTSAYSHKFLSTAEDTFRGWAFVRLLGSTIFPASLHVTDSYKEGATKLLDSLYGQRPTDQNSPEYQTWLARKQDLIDRFIEGHPGSVAYFVSKTAAGEATQTLPYSDPKDQSLFDQFYTGARKVLTPEEFAKRVMWMESYRHYIGTLDQAIGTKSAPDILAGKFDYYQAIDTYHSDWQRFLYMNKDADAFLTNQRRSFLAQTGGTMRTFQTEALIQARDTLRDLAMSTATGGIRDVDYQKALAKLNQVLFLREQAQGELPSSANPIQRGLAWYSQTVLGPYFDKVGPLYDQAKAISARGGSPSAIYDQIRAVENDYGQRAYTFEGQVYPSPEAVFWGNLSPEEQQSKQIHWASEPVGWLTDFQRKQVGYKGNGQAIDTFYTKAADLQKQYNLLLSVLATRPAGQKASPGSKLRTQLDNEFQARLGALAAASGQDALAAFRLDQLTPAERIITAGVYPQSSPVAQLAARAQTFSSLIKANPAGVLPSGYSQVALTYKAPFFASIEAQRKVDAQLNAELTAIGHSMSFGGKDYIDGPLLYNALFFNGFSPYLPDIFKGG